MTVVGGKVARGKDAGAEAEMFQGAVEKIVFQPDTAAVFGDAHKRCTHGRSAGGFGVGFDGGGVGIGVAADDLEFSGDLSGHVVFDALAALSAAVHVVVAGAVGVIQIGDHDVVLGDLVGGGGDQEFLFEEGELQAALVLQSGGGREWLPQVVGAITGVEGGADVHVGGHPGGDIVHDADATAEAEIFLTGCSCRPGLAAGVVLVGVIHSASEQKVKVIIQHLHFLL